MKRGLPATLATLAAALAGCGGDSGPLPPVKGPSADEPIAVAFLAAHNDVRAGTFTGVTLTPTPDPPLPPLAWSQAAADVAQAWANGCTWAHNPGRGADGTARGENIAAFAPAGRAEVTPGYVVGGWGSEWADYTYASNLCAPGAVCGHYTQLVWRGTSKVGCARATCSTGSPFPAFTTWDFVVCDYEPPGNWSGEWPY